MGRRRFTIDDLIALATKSGWAVVSDGSVRRIVLAGRVQNPGDRRVSIWADGQIVLDTDMFGRSSRTPRQAAKHLGLQVDA